MNKKECIALRGIAIMSITLHNYCHWLPFAVPENEFSFDVEKYIQFWTISSWDTLFIQFFSFWGHLGVSVFVLLSGYGLVLKYDNTTINWKSFIVNHYKKLCIPMVLGFIAYYIIIFLNNYPNNQNLYTIIPIKRFVAQTTLIINFLPNPHRLIEPGPYWYFGLTMQLYIIYLLLLYKRSISYITVITLCVFLFSLFLEQNPKLLISTKYNFIGWLFPFIYGIIIGRWKYNPSILQTYLIVAITILLIPLFGYSYYTWLLLPLLVVILATHIITILPIYITNIFNTIGKLSLYIFVLHPITRELTIQYGQDGYPYIGLTLYIILTLILAWAIDRITIFIRHWPKAIK
jgi:peptidoglycan/LPS O-acetylase OafA/YrhL